MKKLLLLINGSIRKVEKTNLSYIEPHRVIIKNTTFLVFNYSNDVYISNLAEKIKLSELENYLEDLKIVKLLTFLEIANHTYGKPIMFINLITV